MTHQTNGTSAMNVTRRNFLRSLMIVPATAALPGSTLSAMMAPPFAGSRNLILLELKGGNDGLNSVVPYGLDGGNYYTEFRPTVNVPFGNVLPLDGMIGLNAALASWLPHYNAGRLAIVNGVSYPEPNRSHAMSRHIWHTGDPDGLLSSGWMARHLSSLGVPPSPNAASINRSPSILMSGSGTFIPAFRKLKNFKYSKDKLYKKDAMNRRVAYENIAADLSGAPSALGTVASKAGSLPGLIDLFKAVPQIQHVGAYPGSKLDDELQLVVQLMAADIGMRYFHVKHGGFDTHSDQNLNGRHANLLQEVADGVAALYDDLSALGLAQDTLVVVFSEFGRTPHENGSGGTDHGTVGPVFVLGDAVSGGLANEHPSMDPANLTAKGQLPRTADFRDVFGTVVQRWLGGDPASVFPGHAYSPLDFLT